MELTRRWMLQVLFVSLTFFLSPFSLSSGRGPPFITKSCYRVGQVAVTCLVTHHRGGRVSLAEGRQLTARLSVVHAPCRLLAWRRRTVLSRTLRGPAVRLFCRVLSTDCQVSARCPPHLPEVRERAEPREASWAFRSRAPPGSLTLLAEPADTKQVPRLASWAHPPSSSRIWRSYRWPTRLPSMTPLVDRVSIVAPGRGPTTLA